MLVIFLAVKFGEYGFQSYRENVLTTTNEKLIPQMQAELETKINQVQKNATQKHSDVSVSDAMLQEANVYVTKKITSEQDEKKRLATAASMFFGYYFTNVMARPDFCRLEGVDIQPFVNAFEKINSNELNKARAILADLSFNESQFITLIKPQMQKQIKTDMNEMTILNKITKKEACQYIFKNADTLADEMQLSKVQPAIFQALSSAK